MSFFMKYRRFLFILILVAGIVFFVTGVLFYVADAKVAESTGMSISDLINILDGIKGMVSEASGFIADDTLMPGIGSMVSPLVEAEYNKAINEVINQAEPGEQLLIRAALFLLPFFPYRALIIVIGLVLACIGLNMVLKPSAGGAVPHKAAMFVKRTPPATAAPASSYAPPSLVDDGSSESRFMPEAPSAPTITSTFGSPSSGASLRCGACGSAVEAGARFCSTCGTPVGHVGSKIVAAPVVVPVMFSDGDEEEKQPPRENPYIHKAGEL